MYQGKRKNKYWSIELKNEVSLLYLDGHMGISQILKEYCIPDRKMVYKWIEQYRKFGTCVDNRGKGTKQQIQNKGRPKKNKLNYQDMSKEELIKELEFRDELKNFLVYLNQQNKNT
ncbi:MAG: helix-turn-helix domain-containing protein [Clostridia bacterium]|nr:helix-turn-helix domain-containing protein [Clostridia bacterium]